MGLKLFTLYKGGNRNAKRGDLDVSDPDIQAIIATASGTQINEATRYNTLYTVSNETDANDIVILPDAPIGAKLQLYASEAFELRSHAPATVGINGGTGANAESAISAGMLVTIQRVSDTAWVGTTLTSAGVTAAIQVAAA